MKRIFPISKPEQHLSEEEVEAAKQKLREIFDKDKESNEDR